jgi:hypothetical protein
MPANEKCYSITTEVLLEMQTAIETNDLKKFSDLMSRRNQLSNCSCGDSYLQQAIQKVYANAIDKFILQRN